MEDLFSLFTARLASIDVRYMITGSVAAMVYGEPRLTHDVDLVVEIRAEAIDSIVAAFPLQEFYCAPRDVIAVEASRPLRGHFNVIHHETGFKADVYVLGSDPLHHWAMARRREFPLACGPVWVAPPEYVILRKLEYYREGGSGKHLRDIRGMLAELGDALDHGELATKIAGLGLGPQWSEVKRGKSEP